MTPTPTDTATTTPQHDPSPATDKIAAALALAQAAISNPQPTRTVTVNHKSGGGSHTYSYVELSAIYDAIRKPFTDNGISWTQTFAKFADGWRLLTTIRHTSGQYIESQFPLGNMNGSIQDIGGLITYARRYSLAPLCGLSAETDSDGQGAEVPVADAEEAIRTSLIECMSDAQLGNAAVLSYVTGAGLDSPAGARSVELLPIATVRTLVENWQKVAADIKAATKKPVATVLPPPERPQQATQEQTPQPTTSTSPGEPELPRGNDALLATAYPDLWKALTAESLTTADLKAYIVAAKLKPADMEPHQYPADFIPKILSPTNWPKVVAGAKKLKK